MQHYWVVSRSHLVAAASPLPPLMPSCGSLAFALFPIRCCHVLRCLAVVDQLLCPPDTAPGSALAGGIAVAGGETWEGGVGEAGDGEGGGGWLCWLWRSMILATASLV